MHANSHYNQEVPSIRPPSEGPMRDPCRILLDQSDISMICRISVALRQGGKSTATMTPLTGFFQYHFF